jgi:protein-tyrosine phosphatase
LVCFFALFSSGVGQTYDRWTYLSNPAYNFRDIGAYDAGTTMAVAIGRVFRSAALYDLTSTDVAIIRTRGIRKIVDVRWPPFTTDSLLLNSFATHVYIPVGFSGTTATEIYQNLVRDNGRQWCQVFNLLADLRNLPLNCHCEAGKDRTGVLTALILTLLGVEREMVIQDYLLSNTAYRYVDRTWIEAALDAVDTSGGIELYLDAIGTPASVRRAVRTNLLVPRPTAARASWHFYR